ncbi:MAG: DUF3872 domain-containing protein [Tannerellaceae bacterium]|nr:DUF3872 domain-containing protein [Tannerellaceae bacterium]
MRKCFSYILFTLLLAAIACACNDDIDIRQDYGYSVETLPLPKSLEPGETVDLEFSILREGYYSETQFRFRYFVSEGEGALTCKGQPISVNRFQEIDADDFVLTWQCLTDEAQRLDFVFEDSFGKRIEYTIEFASEQTEEKPEPESGESVIN